MTTLLASAPTVEITIRGALYDVGAIPVGEFGVSAVRVTKLVNGEVYDLIRTADDRLECTCPDFVVRHSDKGTCCKHLSAMVARGFLPTAPAPVSGGSPVADAPPAVVRPVTEADLKRARYFGLTIAKAAPTPTPVSSPVLEVAPEIEPTASPRDGWGPETDEFVWELGPELAAVEAPALASDAETACPVTEDDHRAWQARQGHSARFAPSVEDDAYASGFYLQLHHGLAVEAPAEWRLMRSSAFRLGQAEGLLARHRREDEETAEWVAARERERSEPREADGYASGYCS